MTKEINLSVNDKSVEMDYFVQGFIDHATRGALAGLEGVGEFESIQNAHVSVAGDKVAIDVNNKSIPANPFVSKIVRNTVVGMVSSLKGVGEIKKVNIVIKR